MMDIRGAIDRLARFALAENMRDTAAMAEALDADLGQSHVTLSKSGVLWVGDARARSDNATFNVIVDAAPKSEITLLFSGDDIYGDGLRDERLGADQRIGLSRTGKGYAILFTLHGARVTVMVANATRALQSISARAL
jgi:hypothetical protein